MPESGLSFLRRDQLLTFDEITRVAAVARSLGVNAVRITGGEPLVRKGLPLLIARLSALGFDELAMTTNGTELAGMAQTLASAGLRRVNVSCDSLQRTRFAAIRRRGDLQAVLRSMDAAEAAGLTPVKVNVVLLRGCNDDEILDFASFARATGRIVRFIEWDRARLVPGSEVLDRISARWPLEPLPDPSGAPAERFRFRDGTGEIGLISSVTEPFCGKCNRLRLTADGAVRNSLFTNHEESVRDILRRECADAELALLLRMAIWAKYPGHGINEPDFLSPSRSMSMIGG
jgi:cyclic pyranopterin phosphate synthase